MKNKQVRATNDNSIIRLGRLRTFLSEIKKLFVEKESGKGLSSNDFTDTLLNKLNGIENSAQVNKIEVVQKNGAILPISNKTVNVTVPTKTSHLSNDSGYITNAVNSLTNYYTKQQIENISNLINYYTKTQTYTKSEVDGLINNLTHLRFEVVDELPQTGNPNIIYLVKKEGTETDSYDEYVFINGKPEFIGTTAVDLTGYLTANDIGTSIAGLGSDKKIKQENLPHATTSIYGAIRLPINESMMDKYYKRHKPDGIAILDLNSKLLPDQIPLATTSNVGGIQLPITKEKLSSDYQKDVANGVVGLNTNNKIDNSHLSLSSLTINNNGSKTTYSPTGNNSSVTINTINEDGINEIINNKFSNSVLNFTGTTTGNISYPLLTGGTKTIGIPTSLPNPQALKFTNADKTKTVSYKGSEEVTVTEKKYTAESLMPLGSVIIWFKKVDVPNGFLECNGAEVSKTQYKDLYSLIGTKFGAETTDKFKLPKLNESVKWYANESETSEEIIYLIKAVRTDVYALSLT